jgi:L-2-hydroxyglutarate oxidase LhgO
VDIVPAKRSLVNGLIYPLPHASGHGLGVHIVKTTGGQVWLGPTIRYQSAKDDYERDRLPVEAFVDPARRLLRGLALEDLRLGGSGIRAKLHPPAESFADFLIGQDRLNPFIIQAAGIDSPGLTSCLAVGTLVAQLAKAAT